MIKIKKSFVESQRFEYSEGVVFWVRPLTGQKLKEIRKQCVKTRMELNTRTRKMEPIEEVDDEKFEDLVADYILDRWEGVGDEDGNPLAVNLESKKLILDHLPLRDFIWGAAQSLDVTETEIKNS